MTAIAVCSGKGSPGATFIAVNLAAALARTGDDALLVDLDLAGGDVGAFLRLNPRKGLQALALLAGPRPRPGLLRREVQRASDFWVVGGMRTAANPESVDVAFLAESFWGVAATMVLDLGRLPGPGVAAAPNADRLLVAVRPDVVSLLGAERALAALDEAGVHRDKVHLGRDRASAMAAGRPHRDRRRPPLPDRRRGPVGARPRPTCPS